MLIILANFAAFLRREEGQGLVEYALMLVLVSIVVVSTLTALGGEIAHFFHEVAEALE